MPQRILKIGVCNCTPFRPGLFEGKEIIIDSLNNLKLTQPYHFRTREIRLPEKEHDKTLRAYLCHVFLEGRTGYGKNQGKIECIDIQLLEDQVHHYFAGISRIGSTSIPVKGEKPPSISLVLKRTAAIISGSYWLKSEECFSRWLEWMQQENIYPELNDLIVAAR